MRNALSPTKGRDKKTRLCTFDIETIKWTRPYALGFYEPGNYKEFDGQHCIKEFIEFFFTYKNRNKICYAHNGGKFDFSFILHELNKQKNKKKFQIDMIRIGSRIAQIKVTRLSHNAKKVKKESWVLRDSVSLLASTLKKLTNNFSVKHLKGDFDHTKINWKNWKELKHEWSPYLESDCRGLFEVLKKFESYLMKKFDCSINKNMTIAQLSMSIYRRKYLNRTINSYTHIEANIRKSYFGGRTEIFNMHGKDLKYFDVNSLYPSVMRFKPMPVGVPIKSFIMTLEDFGIIKAKVTCPDDLDIPLLPHRGKDKKLRFPKGTWTGFYTTPELKKAQEIGYDIKII